MSLRSAGSSIKTILASICEDIGILNRLSTPRTSSNFSLYCDFDFRLFTYETMLQSRSEKIAEGLEIPPSAGKLFAIHNNSATSRNFSKSSSHFDASS